MEGLWSPDMWGSPVGLGLAFFLSGIGTGVFLWGLSTLQGKSNQVEELEPHQRTQGASPSAGDRDLPANSTG